MHGTKDLRQRLHTDLAVQELRGRPERLADPVLRWGLGSARSHTSGRLYEHALDLRDQLLDSGDVAGVIAHVTDRGDHGRRMRVTSPLGLLLTAEQRANVARQAAFSD